jgi:hypothetical protein
MGGAIPAERAGCLAGGRPARAAIGAQLSGRGQKPRAWGEGIFGRTQACAHKLGYAPVGGLFGKIFSQKEFIVDMTKIIDMPSIERTAFFFLFICTK